MPTASPGRVMPSRECRLKASTGRSSTRRGLRSTLRAPTRRRQKFCEESASWPDLTNGNAREYVDAFAGNTPINPTKDWSWVDPEADPYTRAAVGSAAGGFMNATNVENAPTSAKLIGRDWLNDIP